VIERKTEWRIIEDKGQGSGVVGMDFVSEQCGVVLG
jgi:hypothetical protein